MSVVRTWAIALNGLAGSLVEVEADLSTQVPGFDLIGLPDKALGEAVRRVGNACANQGLSLPRRRITVNLSPASLPKRGASFDVAIALAAVGTEHELNRKSLARTAHIGELGLDGRLRPVAGVLPAVHAALRAGIERVVVPYACADEARLVSGIEVIAAISLGDVARLHGLDIEVAEQEPNPIAAVWAPDDAVLDLADVVGQRTAVEALIAAAAGGHHVLLSGPPGAGKTMLASRLPGLLPDLDQDAALEVAAIRSLSGQSVRALPRTVPFEAPHHSTTIPALVGGGSGVVRPGAIARAHHGVLFLDEAAEAASSALDALRQPLESGQITIHRSGVTATFPAQFQLVLATNPCPCGNYGVRGARCECPPAAIRRYFGKLSGPLLDRIDIALPMTRVTVATVADTVGTATARESVLAARERCAHRLRGTPWRVNAHVSGPWLRSGPARLSADTLGPLEAALYRGALTLRAFDRCLRLAWTLADLDGAACPTLEHIGRAMTLKRGTLL